MNNLVNFILASLKQNNNSINFIDIDDTIFKTDAEIIIKDKTGNLKKKLKSFEFTDYKLQPDETIDLEEFSDSDIFYNTAKPVKKTLSKINTLLKQAKHTERVKNNKIIFLTARSDMNNKERFLDTFRKYGIPVDDKDIVYIERAGNLKIEIPKAKRLIMEKYINSGHFNIARFIDDSKHNLDEFLKLEKEYPNIKFEAMIVTNDGKLNSYN